MKNVVTTFGEARKDIDGNFTNVYGGGSSHYEGIHHRHGEHKKGEITSFERVMRERHCIDAIGASRHLLKDSSNRKPEGTASFVAKDDEKYDSYFSKAPECFKATHNEKIKKPATRVYAESVDHSKVRVGAVTSDLFIGIPIHAGSPCFNGVTSCD